MNDKVLYRRISNINHFKSMNEYRRISEKAKGVDFIKG